MSELKGNIAEVYKPVQNDSLAALKALQPTQGSIPLPFFFSLPSLVAERAQA